MRNLRVREERKERKWRDWSRMLGVLGCLEFTRPFQKRDTVLILQSHLLFCSASSLGFSLIRFLAVLVNIKVDSLKRKDRTPHLSS